MNFYIELGFTINPEFTDNNQKCLVWSEHIYIMLQSQEMLKRYMKKQKPDSSKYQTASYTLPVESFEKVNEIIDRGLKAGGTEPRPMIDEGYMQIRTIEDFDGHTWDIIHLDMKKFRER